MWLPFRAVDRFSEIPGSARSLTSSGLSKATCICVGVAECRKCQLHICTPWCVRSSRTLLLEVLDKFPSLRIKKVTHDDGPYPGNPSLGICVCQKSRTLLKTFHGIVWGRVDDVDCDSLDVRLAAAPHWTSLLIAHRRAHLYLAAHFLKGQRHGMRYFNKYVVKDPIL